MSPSGAGPGERGSGSVLVLAMAMIIGLLAAATVLVGQAAVLRHRADSAADLGALAAAHSSQLGDDGCAAAAGVVADDRGVLTACTAQGAGDIEIRVRIAGTALIGLDLIATATARAGPAPGS